MSDPEGNSKFCFPESPGVSPRRSRRIALNIVSSVFGNSLRLACQNIRFSYGEERGETDVFAG